jgi:hypothetical protein
LHGHGINPSEAGFAVEERDEGTSSGNQQHIEAAEGVQ